VVLAWSVAGTPLWNAAWAPTREGLHEAFLHSARLLLILISVGVFLEKTPIPELLAASRTLCRPFEHVGFVRAALVRLALTLAYAESMPRLKDWRSLLDAPVPVTSGVIELRDFPMRAFDRALILLGALLLIASFYFR
jgi:hypothetical protein